MACVCLHARCAVVTANVKFGPSLTRNSIPDVRIGIIATAGIYLRLQPFQISSCGAVLAIQKLRSSPERRSRKAWKNRADWLFSTCLVKML